MFEVVRSCVKRVDCKYTIQLVFSTTRTWIQSSLTTTSREKRLLLYMFSVHSANRGQQYFIQVISNIMRYFTQCYHSITSSNNQKSEQHQFRKCVISAIIFLQNNNEMLSFAKSFSSKVEGMCLQHLPTLSLKGNEPDGLQIDRNAIFSLCE